MERSQAAVAGVDASRTGTLVLEFAAPNPYDDEPGPTNVGVGVELRRVAGIDLTTNEGWQKASDLTLTELVDAGRFDHSYSGVTDVNGNVTFAGLPLGLYRVTPSEADGFAPFAVTLPRTDVSGTTWRYDVTAHPKVGGEEEASPTTNPGPGPTATPRPGGVTTPVAPPASSPEARSSATFPEDQAISDGTSDSGLALQDDSSAQSGDPTEKTDAPGAERTPRPTLAETGAGVIGIALLGLALVLAGLFLSRRKAEETESTEPIETPTHRDL